MLGTVEETVSVTVQEPPPGSGIDGFEFWIPQRRPAGKNLAIKINPPLKVFGAQNLANGFARPTNQPNAWVADFAHEQPMIRLAWDQPQTIALDARSVFELPGGAATKYTLKSPYPDQRLQALALVAGQTESVTLQPFEVLVFDALP